MATSLCWLVQVKYTSKSKTSIPATVEARLGCSQGFLPPTSTWAAAGFHVVDNWVLQGCYDALVGFLEGQNEVLHFPKEPPVDPRRCLQSQRGRAEKGCWMPSAYAGTQALSSEMHTAPREGASQRCEPPDVPIQDESMSCTALHFPRGIPVFLHRAVSSSMAIESWKRDNFLIATRETHINYPHSPATLLRQTYK